MRFDIGIVEERDGWHYRLTQSGVAEPGGPFRNLGALLDNLCSKILDYEPTVEQTLSDLGISVSDGLSTNDAVR
jgi:hypothetical protein